MAYLAELGALIDELVDAITVIPATDRQKLDACRETALRTLRYNTGNFLRTNQFEIEDQLKGFEERFRVVGRDPLADELCKSLNSLEVHRNKWTPDVFRFVLELSDQPAIKSNLGDLDLLAAGLDNDAHPNLTWQEIAKEDGWNEDRALWRNVDFSPSSGDEDEEDAQSATSGESLTTASSAEDEHQRTAHDLTVGPADGDLLLKQARDGQAWRHTALARDGEGRAKKTPISSIQLLREALFMLGGLETTVFDSKCNPVNSYQLAGVSWDTYKSLVTSFAECGRKLAPLRSFVAREEKIPLLQVFQDSLQKALRSLDQDLAVIQGRFVAIEQDAVVSLMGILVELGPSLSRLYSLSGIVRLLQEERNPHAFRYLELLFDAVGIAQLEGNIATYNLLGNIFFDCFQIYLKPIRLWMEDGRLVPGDRTFFVSESSTKLALPQIWKSQFNLLRSTEGQLHAPRFLRPAIHRIFTTGKSIVVLKHLKHHESVRNRRDQDEPRIDFATVCPKDLEFAPFSELFTAAFGAWIQSKHHTASATLRELLFNSYGLSQGLDALQYIYLMSDGSKSNALSMAIFRHLDSFSASWKDRFTLTEIAQEAFSLCVDGYRLSAEVDPRGLAHSGTASRSSVRLSLPAIRLSYRLNWPVQIIVPVEAVQGYQTIFTFLLQTRRAISFLAHPILGFSHAEKAGAAAHLATYYLLRTKLLWFCNTIMTYLTSLVLAPNTTRLREGLREAPDVDDMISTHSSFINRIISESCQSPKLQPIRECILDIFDLAIKVEDAHRFEMERLAEEDEEISRLSVMSSPFKESQGRAKSALYAPKPKGKEGDDDDEDEDGADWGNMTPKQGGAKDAGGHKSHAAVLKDMHTDFERYLRFVAGGLRGVARASREEAAGKWDLLAEMLEVGIREQASMYIA
ncbi:Spc98 family-domain-containing protein [Lasiosphaeria hispida]|uniref:Spindle pole body component n=1 Tax=Lasiosphaeria hispida TaxID=260671 RepID=A0AAJ0HRC8_9PEZI|nr:Spc98 family-domain-containing protein [Lasiosphaeria hispida]